MPPRARLLQLLNDHDFVSGTALGNQLGMSRAAVHKHVSQLRDAGLPLDCVRGRGYRLARGITPLDAALIRELLEASARARLGGLCIEQSVNSTNDSLRRLSDARLLHGKVCLAEAQPAGRGRYGNRWIASPYRNLIMSMGWVYSSWPEGISGLAIAVGIELIDALKILGVSGLSLKWPNDIVFGDKKLGGILIEVSGETAGSCSVIIGVGLNVEIAEADGAFINQPWADLVNDLGCLINRNHLAACCITRLFALMQRYEAEGFAPYRHRWHDVDALRGRPVTVTYRDSGKQLCGRAVDLDRLGGLRIRQAGGRETVCYHGDVSARRQ